MNILNLYYSSTGNTEKVALQIHKTIELLGHRIETMKITSVSKDIDILQFDLVFMGSGVYSQLPGQALIELHRSLLRKYSEAGEIKSSSPRRPSFYAVVYCTYGGVHTGINEAIPAIKYMGQLFDHLGYTIIGEWFIVGEYMTERLRDRSVNGRLGDIRGRPNKEDLREIAERVKGILQTLS